MKSVSLGGVSIVHFNQSLKFTIQRTNFDITFASSGKFYLEYHTGSYTFMQFRYLTALKFRSPNATFICRKTYRIGGGDGKHI